MANVTRQSGRTSGFGYAKQSALGTYVAPTDVIRAASFDTTDQPNIEFYVTLNQILDAETDSRSGVHKVGAKLSYPFFNVMGAGLIKAAVGQDTLSGATPVALGTTTAVAMTVGQQTVTLTSGPSAPPGNINEWVPGWMIIDTGINAETAPILSIAGAVITTWPLTKAHAVSVTVSLPVQHFIQPLTGVNVANLDYVSIVAQYARMFERSLLDCRIADFNIKGDNKRLMMDMTVVSDQLVNAETSTLTTLTPATGEATDSPFIMRDGGLISNYALADTTPSMHGRLTALDYKHSYAVQAEIEGGGVQLAEVNVIGKRTQMLTWTENAGVGSPLPTMHRDYVNTANTLPAWLAWNNAKTGFCMSVWFPVCAVDKYDPVGPTDRPIAYSGSLHPLYDTASGRALKIAVYNGTSTVL